MLTSRAWPQGTDPNFSGQQYRQTFTRKMAVSQKAYIYMSTMYLRGGGETMKHR